MMFKGKFLVALLDLFFRGRVGHAKKQVVVHGDKMIIFLNEVILISD